jgi:fucose permease
MFFLEISEVSKSLSYVLGGFLKQVYNNLNLLLTSFLKINLFQIRNIKSCFFFAKFIIPCSSNDIFENILGIPGFAFLPFRTCHPKYDIGII